MSTHLKLSLLGLECFQVQPGLLLRCLHAPGSRQLGHQCARPLLHIWLQSGLSLCWARVALATCGSVRSCEQMQDVWRA